VPLLGFVATATAGRVRIDARVQDGSPIQLRVEAPGVVRPGRGRTFEIEACDGLRPFALALLDGSRPGADVKVTVDLTVTACAR
jgi:hypothetical protein